MLDLSVIVMLLTPQTGRDRSAGWREGIAYWLRRYFAAGSTRQPLSTSNASDV